MFRSVKVDQSSGYEAIAQSFSEARSREIGPATVLEWARGLQPGAAILDLGCGNGVPISEALLGVGFRIYGVDGSESLVRQFRARFAGVPVECNAVEDSRFFDRSFGGVIAWGLLFLLTADSQRKLIRKVARVLNLHGQFLFTAPREMWNWQDAMTGLESLSLGKEAYEAALRENGLSLDGTMVDEGENHYYFAKKGAATYGYAR